jgi:DNA-directed RNA polymerase specialized sigma24 family protein
MKHSNELLGLLVTIVQRKAVRQLRKSNSGKAGGGKVLNEPDSGFEPEGREPSPLDAMIEAESVAQLELVIGRWHDYMREKWLLDVAKLVLEGEGYRQIAASLSIRESKARRLITTVNTLTGAFGKEEDSDA